MARHTFEISFLSTTRPSCAVATLLACGLLLHGPAAAANGGEARRVELTKPADPSTRVSITREGALQSKEGLTLRLSVDLGSVKIVPLAAGAPAVVRYAVHIETDAHTPLAEHLLERYSLIAKATSTGVEIEGKLPPQAGHSETVAQFWVQFEVSVPQSYSVDVNTAAGDIEVQDIGGMAVLNTQGGNIRAGSIGTNLSHDAGSGHLVARLQTGGGHIQVRDVAGDVKAITAGGHILAGNIAGDASLHSGGGHIRAGQIGGRADLQTEGGNIAVGQANGLVSVRTGGGQIDFGEVRGSVRAQTGGGGIRIMYVSGPMEVESSAGSICLTRVAGTVRAATAGGTIRAWINPDAPSSGGTVHLAGASQLTSGNGDIIVFLPRNLAADIDALVESGSGQHIQADPGLSLNIESPSGGNGPVHASAMLNGGGAPLKLRTTAGNIRLEFLDSQTALRDSLIREQQERLSERLNGNGFPLLPASFPFTEPAVAVAPPSAPDASADWINSWVDRIELTFLGEIREDPDEFMRRLVESPRPAYPEIARRAGLQGIVKLQVRATLDGRVEVQKILEGEPALANAAAEAVKGWRVKPVEVDGKQAEAISTVTFNFQLH